MEFCPSKALITYQQQERLIHVQMDLRSTLARRRGQEDESQKDSIDVLRGEDLMSGGWGRGST